MNRDSSGVYSGVIDRGYYEKLRKINLPSKPENNLYLVLHLHGDGAVAPKNFNIKVYKSGKGVLKLVTTSKNTLEEILEFGVCRSIDI